MSPDDVVQGVFGGVDGLTSTVAIVVAGLLAGSQRSLVASGFSIAIAAGVGMGYSEFVSDRTHNRHRALVMAMATFLCSALPVLPFIALWKLWGGAASGGIAIALALALSKLRASLTDDSGPLAVARTFTGIVLVGALCCVPSLLA